ncbi:DHH family phosphoesterase [Desulfitobacterium chlororespirans]|uniref:Phosphoesterase RecJ domain-containing protein n=1 Tax=Desulfitobacterium chlororespirans DSM 11544 TaxID=1121395 RepID=A0A1M7TLX4_9FIRM|nr:bifunctional oligoribonuclease/PAP phosphatase NrnA [Desulfitobacterium chlororespirans]SHN71732.1 phosphoesterase RecJ domain-containing protein [Desulfitobacterium chlororespirans DSM 11544]
MMNSVITQMAEELRKASKVALFSHVSPDGDCIGSMLGIGLALEALGKEVAMFNPDPIPRNLSFLSGVDKITQSMPDPLPETLLFVDCADLQRVQLQREDLPADAVILNLDHHISNQNFGRINWVDSQAAASGELAYALVRRLNVELTQEIAANFYTALLTDTGSFKYSNTTAKTHQIAGELIEAGISLSDIHHFVFDQTPMVKLELLRRGLNQLQFFAEGQLGMMTLRKQDFEESGAEESLSEGLIDHARTVEGVEVAVLLKEAKPDVVRVSLRSNRWFDVNRIADSFGGGGHQRAAGCTLQLSLEEAKQKIRQTIEEELKLGRSH